MTIQFSLRKYIYLLTLLIGTGLIDGCMNLPMLIKDPDIYIDELTASHEFAKALSVIDTVNKDHIDYDKFQQKRAAVLQSISQYEKSIVDEAIILKANNEWQKSITLLDKSLQHLPADSGLTELRNNLELEKNTYLNIQLLALATLRAENINQQLILLKNIQKATDNENSVQTEVRLTDQQANSSRARLLQQALKEAKQQQWPQAYTHINLVEKISSDNESSAARQSITQHIQQQKINEFITAVNNDDLPAAKIIAAQMDSYRKLPEVAQALVKLEKKISLATEKYIELGEKYYAKGSFDRAIKNWSNALKLDPDNADIKNRLLRVEVFKSNYQKLQTDE